MQIVRFERRGMQPEVGVLRGEQIYSLAPMGYRDTLALLHAGPEAWARAESLHHSPVALGDMKLLAPIANPPRIFGVGLNYLDHAAEAKMQVQSVPTVFLKLPQSIVGPDDEVVLPSNSVQVDYEAELAVVIGKGGYRIAREDWQEHVFGYTIVNDVSARDV